MHFKASQAVFWSLSCYKELKRTRKPFTVCTLRGLLIQMQTITLRSLGMCRKQNFEGFKSNTAVLTFILRFLSSPPISLFLPHFFSFAGHLVGFTLVGKVFRKAFRILGLDERESGTTGSGTRFSWKFSGECNMFFAFFSSVRDWILLILVWFERSLHSGTS